MAEDLFLLRFDDKIETNPGQFVFAWIPETGEKPFSVFDDEPLTLLIKKRGCLTEKLQGLNKGNYLYIRGSYGNSPKIKGKTLLVGGGTGIAGLYLFAKRNKNTMEYLTKCGIGLCGTCANSNGYRSCVDGTFFKD